MDPVPVLSDDSVIRLLNESEERIAALVGVPPLLLGPSPLQPAFAAWLRGQRDADYVASLVGGHPRPGADLTEAPEFRPSELLERLAGSPVKPSVMECHQCGRCGRVFRSTGFRYVHTCVAGHPLEGLGADLQRFEEAP